MNSLFLSVVTRTKNRDVTLKRLGEELKKQNFKDFEWVIVNDSGDFSIVENVANAARSGGLKVIAVDNKISKGRSFAANLGVTNSSGKYVIIFDDDDFPRNNFFEKIYKFFMQFPQYAGVACWTEVVLEEINNNDQIISHGTEFFYRPQPYDLSILGFHTTNIPPCSVVLRRDKFLNAGGYPEHIEYTEDWAFITNFVMNEGDIGLIPEELVCYSKRINPQGYYKNTTSEASSAQQHLSNEVIWKNERVRRNDFMDIEAIAYGGLNAKMNVIIEQIVLVKQQLNKKEILDEILSSKSWRVTAPLRYLSNKIKIIGKIIYSKI